MKKRMVKSSSNPGPGALHGCLPAVRLVITTMLLLLHRVDLRAEGGVERGHKNAADRHLHVADFSSAASCAECHSEIYQQWRGSAHARAATDPIFQKLLPQAARDLGGLGVGFCLKCHTPVATVAGEVLIYSPVSLPLQLSPVAMEGVTCDFCHTFSGRENFGKDISPGIYLYPRKGETAVKYGSHADASTSNHFTKVSRLLLSAEFCGICHKFNHPFTGAGLQDTYEEWKNGPYSKSSRAGGKRCQDCHMPEFTGQSAVGGLERTNLHAHVFPGGRSDLVKKVASVAVWASVHKHSGRDQVSLTAEVTNVGSGHLLPTGLPGLRQMWLEVVVRDAKGGDVFASRSSIGIEPLDAAGRPTMPWNAVRFGTDTRIGPQKRRQTVWDFPRPELSAGPLEIRVAVFYRSISPLAAQAAGIEPSAAIEIASDRLRLFPDGRVEKIPVE
jgi:nitrate/TMAO reductase-like tetraheme cytochrome c subunit